MPTSTVDLCAQTERLLVHHDREAHNRLVTGIDSDDTSLTVEFDATGIEKDVQLAIDFELLRVWERADKTITVERGDEETTEAAHSGGARIVVKPRYPRAHILQALNDELAALTAPNNGLFKMTTLATDITYDQGVYGYNLTADFLEAYEVSWEPVASTKDRTFLAPGTFETRRGLDTTDFASGNAIFLPPGITHGAAVRVRYKAGFSSIAADTADINTTSGLPTTATDLLPLGASIRLMAPLELARNYVDAQGDSRRSDEVPPGAIDRSVRGLMVLRDQRVRDEAARLRQQFATVMR